MCGFWGTLLTNQPQIYQDSAVIYFLYLFLVSTFLLPSLFHIYHNMWATHKEVWDSRVTIDNKCNMENLPRKWKTQTRFWQMHTWNTFILLLFLHIFHRGIVLFFLACCFIFPLLYSMRSRIKSFQRKKGQVKKGKGSFSKWKVVNDNLLWSQRQYLAHIRINN